MKHWPIFSALAIATIAGIHPAAAAVLWVTNDGADSSSCGSQTTPCRSISQGIENASDGDTIEVGAGHYGNVSGNVNYTGPGDEHPRADAGCIVCITKGLSIFSVHGAAVTVIDSLPSSPFGTTVMILSDGVHFGQAGGGFTASGGGVGDYFAGGAPFSAATGGFDDQRRAEGRGGGCRCRA